MILTLAHLRKIVEVFYSKCKWIKTSFKNRHWFFQVLLTCLRIKKTVILFKNTFVFYKTTNSGEVLRKWKRNKKCIINFCIINFLPKRRHVLSICRKYCVANMASRDKWVKDKKWLASVFVVGWAGLCVSVSEHFHMLYFTCELFMPSKMAKLNLQNLNKMT